MIYFAENLKKLRIETGKSQKDLAQALKTTQRRISHLECGEIVPDVYALVEIAEYFKLNLDELVLQEY